MASQRGLNPNASEFWPVNHPRNPTNHFLTTPRLNFISTTHDQSPLDSSVSYNTPKTTNTPPAPPSSPPPTAVHPPTPTPSSLAQPTGSTTYHFLTTPRLNFISSTHGQSPLDSSVSYNTPKTTTNTPPAPPSSPPPTAVHPPTPTPSSLAQPTGSTTASSPARSLGKHESMVFCCCGNNTTVVIRNVPNWTRREDVILLLNRHCYIENRKGQQITSSFDFVHLPMNNRNGTSSGYALVNFSSPVAARIFYHAFDDRYNVFWGSRNKVQVVASLIQGKEALVNEFEATMFDCETEDFLPLCFSPARDGSKDQLVTMSTVGRCRATSASSSSNL